MLTALIQRVRPAWLQSQLLTLLGLNRRQTVTYRNLRYFVDPTSDLGSSLCRGSYEEGMWRVIEEALPAGGTFVDLGANEGFFTVHAARQAGPGGQVVAIEPQSRLQSVIRRNLELNGVTNCQIYQGVVSNKSGEMELHLAPGVNSGASSLYLQTKYRVPTETVPAWTLNDLLTKAGLDRVDLLKMDVEGAEYDIITSSAPLLASHRIRAIALEYHHSTIQARGLNPDLIHETLLENGYKMVDQNGCSVYHLAAA